MREPAKPTGVHIPSEVIYESVKTIESQVIRITAAVEGISTAVGDHETRIREIEAREDLSRRVVHLEEALRAMEEGLRVTQRRVWAWPSLAGVGAVIAIVFAIAEMPV